MSFSKSLTIHTRKYQKRLFLPKLNTSVVCGKFLHMRTGLVTISDESTKNHYNIPWKDNNLSHEYINTVLLVGCLYKGIERHHQYIRYLYLDLNQTRGEMKPGKEGYWLVTMEYMMKLRAKIHQSDSSKFHALMTKGCSVHVFFIKGRMTEEVLHRKLADKGDD